MAFPGGMPGKVCYICGRNFGSKSLDIHQKQCLKKREAEQAKLPKHLRTKLVAPSSPGIGGGGMDNDEAFKNWKQSLAACPNCGRTFLPDRLEVHLRSCKPGAKRVDINRAAPVATSPAERSGPGSVHKTGNLGLAARTGRGGASPAAGGYDDQDEDDGGDEPPPPARSPAPRRAAGGTPVGRGGSRAGASAGPPPTEFGDGGDLAQCSNCGRSFNADRLAKHESVCGGEKKRKVFNSTKKRVEGTDAAAFVRKGVKDVKPTKTHWREKHEAFIRAVRDARSVTAYQKAGGNIADLPPPPPDAHPEYVQCPHCTRRFAPGTAERHIPKCAGVSSKAAPPPTHNRFARAGAPSARSPAAPSRGAPPRSAGRPAPRGYADDEEEYAAPSSRLPAPRATAAPRSPAGGGRSPAPRSPAPASRAAPASRGGGGGGMSKFCGDCGKGYGASTQKFCGECGAPR